MFREKQADMERRLNVVRAGISQVLLTRMYIFEVRFILHEAESPTKYAEPTACVVGRLTNLLNPFFTGPDAAR